MLLSPITVKRHGSPLLTACSNDEVYKITPAYVPRNLSLSIISSDVDQCSSISSLIEHKSQIGDDYDISFSDWALLWLSTSQPRIVLTELYIYIYGLNFT